MDYIGLECLNGSVIRHEIHTPGVIVTIVALGLINLLVVIGNSLVVAAVITTRKLRTVTNIFIVSLACADLLLSFAVLPFSISVEVLKLWLWGPIWCNMWLAIDVWLCTASILSLCAISLDRYIAVTRPIRYPSIVSPFRGKILVSTVWILSFVICLPPLLGWNDTEQLSKENISTNDTGVFTNQSVFYQDTMYSKELLEESEYYINNISNMSVDYQYDGLFSDDSVTMNKSTSCDLHIPRCELTPTKGYRIYAAMGSFFIPMLVLIYFYFRIYLAAMKTAAAIRKGVLTTKSRTNQEITHQNGSSGDDVQLRVHRGGSTSSSQYSYARTCSVRRSNEYSNEAPVTSVTPRYLSNVSRSSNARSSNDSMTNELIVQRVFSNNYDTADDTSAQNSLLVLFGSFGKRLKRVRKNKDNVKCNRSQRDNTEMEVLNPTSGLNKNGKQKSFQEHKNGVYDALLRDKSKRMSPRRCKLIIKETKSSVNAKGHARKFRRETKAAKTLAIIVGAFIICWLPFFTIYLLGAFCQDCVSDIVFSVFFWLGYCNSALNPCIYAMFSRDFRFAFKQLLSCKRSKGFNQASRADYVTGVKKTLAPPPLEHDSASDQ